MHSTCRSIQMRSTFRSIRCALLFRSLPTGLTFSQNVATSTTAVHRLVNAQFVISAHSPLLVEPCAQGKLLQFLASLLRPLGKDLSLFLDSLSGTHFHYPSEKCNVLQLLKRYLRLIFFKSICAEVQVLVSVCITQEVCVSE